MRGDLHLSYAQIGLLAAVPLLAGGLLELPLGLIAGYGRRRHRLVLIGGLAVTASLVAVAAAPSFLVLLLAFTAFYPAAGAFVTLTQSALMDADPARQQQRMAAWNLVGSCGDVAGPLLLAAVLTLGGTWRAGYLGVAGVSALFVGAAALAGPTRRGATRATGPVPADTLGPAPADTGGHSPAETGERTTVRQAVEALRGGQAVRWLALLQITDLLGDVLTGFVGVYLVDVAHVSPARAALGVAVRLGGGLAGDAAFAVLAGRLSARAAVRLTAVAAGLLYPAFLLVPYFPAKLVLLAAVSVATACWYPACQAGLYSSLPGRSGIAVFWSSAAGIAGAAGPLAVGLFAARFGLAPALACLAVTPLLVATLAR
jgi:MFS transporter, FSR family, fosmidomycin resistance protein